MKRHVFLISKLPARAQDDYDDPWSDGKISGSEMLHILSELIVPFAEMVSSKDPEVR